MMDLSNKPIQFQRGHGSLWDRGVADSWYMRNPIPHYIQSWDDHVTDLTEEERNEYFAGYEWNEEHGDHKLWDE